jgi:2-polyprenyl-6-methoxyphenol hydroxylase-like FAD-dependent oxidoreductase
MRVIIAGGGIGGLTLAHGLARSGAEVRVIESARRQDRLGTGITLLENALRALDRIGLADPIVATGSGWGVVSTRDAAGTVLHEQELPKAYKPGAPPAVGIMRTHLGDLLEEHATASGASIAFETTVERIEQRDGAVSVALSDGETGTYDLLVAADGAYSRTRTLLFGEDRRPVYSGQGVWRYTIPRPADVHGLTLHRTRDGAVVGALPLSEDDCYLFYLENTAEHVHMPPDRLGELLRERLAPFGAPMIRDAVDGMDASRHISFRPIDHVLLPAPWHQGRVVLLGDAAHAVTPQLTSGGGMAIEDAVVLCEELDAHTDVEAALDAYGTRRAGRVRPIYEHSLAICKAEQDPAIPDEQTVGIMMNGYALLAQRF